MHLEQAIERARETARARAFLYEDERTFVGGIEEALRALEEALRVRDVVSA